MKQPTKIQEWIRKRIDALSETIMDLKTQGKPEAALIVLGRLREITEFGHVIKNMDFDNLSYRRNHHWKYTLANERSKLRRGRKLFYRNKAEHFPDKEVEGLETLFDEKKEDKQPKEESMFARACRRLTAMLGGNPYYDSS